jgi:anaerobic ribonucleoside-triphosphate reductase activating protein
MKNEWLNIADFQMSTTSLGPGKRFALWVQGCPFNCENCIAPDWIPFKQANIFSPVQMAEIILNTPGIDGITISGGEPMMQARRLAAMLEIVRVKKPGLNVIIFSGFRLKQLAWEDARLLLDHVDVLIDGLYREKLNDGLGLRGSANQQVHFLTEALRKQEKYFLERPRNLEFHIKSDGVLMVGIPEKAFKW